MPFGTTLREIFGTRAIAGLNELRSNCVGGAERRRIAISLLDTAL